MKVFLTTILCAIAVATASAQPVPLYENFGTITAPPQRVPQIDATAFANYGSFSVVLPLQDVPLALLRQALPYDFQNTLYFTNRGSMTASPGFRFAKGSTAPPAFRPADTFVNDIGASISVLNVPPFFLPFGTFVFSGTFFSSSLLPSYLLVEATNVVNHGIMTAGAIGLLQLTGRDVDVSRGGMGIERIDLSPSFFATETNFFPDPGITDLNWELGTNSNFQLPSLLQITATATNVLAPPMAISITNELGLVSVYTNAGATNAYRQAAFVALSDSNFTATVKWAPGPTFTPYQSAVVEIAMRDTNVVTGDLEFSTLYVLDQIASSTNFVLLTNLSVLPLPSFMPATLQLMRTPPIEFLTGVPGNSELTNTFFFDPADTNFAAMVTNIFDRYSARVDSVAGTPPNVPLLAVTDQPGRVEITATNLQLAKARVRGTGLASVRTGNLLSSAGVIMDAENVLFDMSVPPGQTLTVQGVVKERVVRLNGQITAWSAIWTNFYGTSVTNQVDDGTGNLTNEVTTTVNEIDYHILIVDATGLRATKPVTTHDFITHADQFVFGDTMTVVRNLVIDSDSFTLNGRINYRGGNMNFGLTNAPRLKSYTGKGTFDIGNAATFGARTNRYDSFANRGTLDANGVLIYANSFENSGTITSRVDGIIIDTETAQFQNANTLSANDLSISGTDIRFTASTNGALGMLALAATRSLADAGDTDNNLFVTEGIELPIKPNFGDLLGTTVQIVPRRFARVENSWAGEDRGPSASGFENNVAIGHMILGGGFDSQSAFRGATGGNGMYVDFLEIADPGPVMDAINAGDLTAALDIDPSLTIYFADSNVPVDQLESLSGGRLVHVEFGGGAAFVQVPVRSGNGTAQMQRAVRESTTLDSDGDGIPNASDPYPLDFDSPLQLIGSRANNQTSIVVSWQAQPQLNYRVEYTPSLRSANWQLLSTFTNGGAAPQTATVTDQILGEHTQRYYRVRLAQ